MTITLGTAQTILDVAAYLGKNPWSERSEIEAALGIDTRTLARILLRHLELRTRPRPGNKQRPLQYALPDAPPNPYATIRGKSCDSD